MTILTIFLGIIVLLLILFVILYYLNKKSSTGILDLKTSVPPITSDNISKPTSPNYYYSTWVYVNMWDSAVKTLFAYDNQKLTLDNNTQTLKFHYKGVPGGSNAGASSQDITITSTFPIQKWAHVAVSKSGNVLDFYLDGKLIKSYQTTSISPADATGSSITFGDGATKHDIFLAKFQRSPKALDARSAWNMYLLGPGTGVPMGSDYNYNINLSVTKDSIVQKTYKLY
jgi:hypothetical protein